jgi:hypothetical protein
MVLDRRKSLHEACAGWLPGGKFDLRSQPDHSGKPMSLSTFEPIFPNHAIERCSATFAFRDALPDKVFTALKNSHDTLIRKAGFETQESIGVQIDVATGHVVKRHGGLFPAMYNSLDKADAIFIAPNSVTWQTVRYIMWDQFESKLETLIYHILDTFLSSVSGSLIRMEYVDCFIWSGTWDNFDSTNLLGQDSDFTCRAAQRAGREWHTHSGWIADDDKVRRVYNVNVNAVSRRETGEIKPAITIFTLAQDQNVEGQQTGLFDTSAEAKGRLQSQHQDLKNLLGRVISPAMAQRIHLHSSLKAGAVF